MKKDWFERLTGLKKTKDAKDIKYKGRGSRPEGSPPPTIFKSTKNKKKGTNKKLTQAEKARANIARNKVLKGVKSNKQVSNKSIKKIVKPSEKGKFDIKEHDTVKKGKALAKKAGLNPSAGVYYDKKKDKVLAAVTAEELKKSGMSLRDYLNKQRGLTRRDKTQKKGVGGKIGKAILKKYKSRKASKKVQDKMMDDNKYVTKPKKVMQTIRKRNKKRTTAAQKEHNKFLKSMGIKKRKSGGMIGNGNQLVASLYRGDK